MGSMKIIPNGEIRTGIDQRAVAAAIRKIPRKPRELTVKQRRFVKNIVSGKNGKQSVQEAGYNVVKPIDAAVIAHRNLQKPKIKQSIQEALAAEGLDEKHWSQELKTLYNLKRVHQDKVINYPSESAKAKALELDAKVRGLFAPDNINIQQNGDIEIVYEEGETNK